MAGLERMTSSLIARVERLETDVAEVRRDARALSAEPLLPAPPPARPEFAAPASAPVSQAPERLPADASRQRFTGLEDALGGRLLAWLGSIAILIGLAFFFAYAVSRGWLGESARTALAGLVSLGLLGAGIWLQEHRGRTDAGRTVAATAIAALFMTVVVASRVYEVIPVWIGLALALSIGTTATVLAIRWDARVVAAVGIVSALAAPLLVGAPSDGKTLAFLFVAALSAVGVVVWRRWEWLGLAVALLCAPQWVAWLFSAPTMAGALIVLSTFGALGVVAAIGFELRVPQAGLRASSSFLLALNAAVLALAGRAALARLGHPDAGDLWLAALAAAHLVAGLLAGRTGRVSHEVRLLTLGLGVVLGDVAFGLIAQGPVLAAGWAGTAIVFARLAASRGQGRGEQVVAGVGLGGHIALATLTAVVQTGPAAAMGGPAGDRAAATIALAAVVAGMFASARLSAGRQERWRIALDALGLGLVAYLTAINLDGAQLVVALALESVALGRLARRNGDLVAGYGAVAFLGGAILHVITVEAAPRALELGAPDLPAAAVALSACAAASLALARLDAGLDPRIGRTTFAGVGVASLLYLISVATITAFQPGSADAGATMLDLTVRQLGQVLLSALWGVAGVGALVVGLRRDVRLLRLGALGLLLVTVVKVFLYDIAMLDSGYRVASFVALGMLLLLGAHAYQRRRPRPAPDLRTMPQALR